MVSPGYIGLSLSAVAVGGSDVLTPADPPSGIGHAAHGGRREEGGDWVMAASIIGLAPKALEMRRTYICTIHLRKHEGNTNIR